MNNLHVKINHFLGYRGYRKKKYLKRKVNKHICLFKFERTEIYKASLNDVKISPFFFSLSANKPRSLPDILRVDQKF